MILADKIIRLRKRNGWSQEELAEKMNVSRQAVSKWEGAQTVPDLEKILKLGELFGVTTDYLLKDELDEEEFAQNGTDSSVRVISMEEAHEYLESRRRASVLIAVATFLCMISPICLFVLGAASEVSQWHISENFAGTAGIIVLLLIVAVAVIIFISCGYMNAKWEFLEKDSFENAYGVSGMVREKQKAYRRTYNRFNLAGAVVCVLSPCALFCGSFMENDFYMTVMLTVTLFIAAIGVVCFVLAGVRWASMQRLLQEGDYTSEAKEKNRIKDAVGLVYWLIATAVYLAWSFLTNAWDITWIVWVVAGILFVAVMTICNLVGNNCVQK